MQGIRQSCDKCSGFLYCVLYCRSLVLHSLQAVFLCAGVCGVVHWQKLTCPYSELQQDSLPRFWCRQTSADCCTGLAFNQSAHSVHGGKVRVTQGSDFFTVEALKPSHGGGVYWCGVLSKNGTIIKLAEGRFHNCKQSSIFRLWSTRNWIRSSSCRLCRICHIASSIFIGSYKPTANDQQQCPQLSELFSPLWSRAQWIGIHIKRFIVLSHWKKTDFVLPQFANIFFFNLFPTKKGENSCFSLQWFIVLVSLMDSLSTTYPASDWGEQVSHFMFGLNCIFINSTDTYWDNVWLAQVFKSWTTTGHFLKIKLLSKTVNNNINKKHSKAYHYMDVLMTTKLHKHDCHCCHKQWFR